MPGILAYLAGLLLFRFDLKKGTFTRHPCREIPILSFTLCDLPILLQYAAANRGVTVKRIWVAVRFYSIDFMATSPMCLKLFGSIAANSCMAGRRAPRQCGISIQKLLSPGGGSAFLLHLTDNLINKRVTCDKLASANFAHRCVFFAIYINHLP